MRTVKRIATTISMTVLGLFAALPAWAQQYPPQPPQPGPGPGVGAGAAGAGAGAAGAGAGAGGIAFTGADIMVGLAILAGLIVIGWAALAAGRRRERVTTS
jgi:hypothetical protein